MHFAGTRYSGHGYTIVDSSPSTTATNTYQVELRRVAGGSVCQFDKLSDTGHSTSAPSFRGFIATVTG